MGAALARAGLKGAIFRLKMMNSVFKMMNFGSKGTGTERFSKSTVVTADHPDSSTFKPKLAPQVRTLARSINRWHVYTEEHWRDLSIAGMYIQKNTCEIYQSPACIIQLTDICVLSDQPDHGGQEGRFA